MTIEPGYGETPLEPDEADALTPQAREIFGGRPMKVELYEAEQAVSVEVGTAFLKDVVAGRLVLADLLSDVFVRTLHRALYGDLWTWAGRYRTRDLNIGVAPAHIAAELRGSLETIRYVRSGTRSARIAPLARSLTVRDSRLSCSRRRRSHNILPIAMVRSLLHNEGQRKLITISVRSLRALFIRSNSRVSL
ncbi:hypothetical protein [Rathayibacter rathayi]|uniref:hypothetical protein n=1 Tax=Rathayibacter rathayi TaxID=33887 RepID=UPI000BD024CD|nr:hypothetical protein [Rathayibacter rathayi]MWV74367.1 hypothetical protein [Rathayibacter rathayi NCPPB 2980 = VKM Ac-1601]PPH66518.1 hypothetical protein C5C45_09785 [Rathayibacter rathayi]TWD70535.1 hypothetical protein FB469_2327 [Rathayibacter rathayi]SOE04416.1 hypothetical protein SAMN06295924_10489 [Rathayibacter rathayi NCPPB 2980 = VKM Ac-1601]